MILRLDCSAKDPRNGNGIFAANEGNEWTQEFAQLIYFIHFFFKLPTANLNATGAIGIAQAGCTVCEQFKSLNFTTLICFYKK